MQRVEDKTERKYGERKMYKEIQIETEEGFGNHMFPVLKSEGKTVPFDSVIGWQVKMTNDLKGEEPEYQDVYFNQEREEEMLKMVAECLSCKAIKENPHLFKMIVLHLSQRGAMASKLRLGFFQDEEAMACKLTFPETTLMIDSNHLAEAILDSLSSSSLKEVTMMLCVFGEVPEEGIPKTEEFDKELIEYVKKNQPWKNDQASNLWFVDVWKRRIEHPEIAWKASHRVRCIQGNDLPSLSKSNKGSEKECFIVCMFESFRWVIPSLREKLGPKQCRTKDHRKNFAKAEMGATFSQSIVATREVTNTFNNTVLSSVQRCSQNFGITQTIDINGDNNVIQNVFLNQNTGVNFSCFGTTQNQLDLLNDITNKITSQANANAQFTIGFAFAQSVNFSTTIANTLNNTFLQSIQECVSTDPVFQGISVTGDNNQVIGATLNQNSEFYSKCVFDSKNVANITNQITNDVNASANSQAGSEIGFALIIIVIIIVIIAIIFFVLWGKFPFDKFAKKNTKKKTTKKKTDASKTSSSGEQTPSQSEEEEQDTSSKSSDSGIDTADLVKLALL